MGRTTAQVDGATLVLPEDDASQITVKNRRLKCGGLWGNPRAYLDQTQSCEGLRCLGQDTGGCVASLPLYRP
jgi:hypothetical protein